MQSAKPKWIKEYFSFTRKERNATLLLGLVALFFSLLPSMFPFLVKEEIKLTADTAIQQQLAALAIKSKDGQKESDAYNDAALFQPNETKFGTYHREKFSGTLFYFDPNKATADDWKKLGVREKTIGTILKYRSKGGRFYKPEDLKRIYGLRPEEVERLLPYVAIAENEKSISMADKSYTKESFPTNRKEFATVIDINGSDTSEWKRLKGIGSGYAKRIVNFRTKLGGFVSVEQVAETYGLPDSVYQNIKPLLKNSSTSIRKINLNNCTIDELKAHPYIAFSVANAIVQYRKEHGPFASVAELQKIGAIDERIYRKISPYLEAEK